MHLKTIVVSSSERDISDAAAEMLLKFNKYWSEYVDVLSFAIILDPRFKWRFVHYALTKQRGNIEGTRVGNEVRIQFDGLFKVYEGLVPESVIPQRESTSLETTIGYTSLQVC